MSIHLDREAHQLKALGHAAVGVFNAAVLIAIVAVILSASSRGPAMIQGFFGLLSWLVEQVVKPVGQGNVVKLSGELKPAGGYDTSAGAAGAGGSSGAPGTGLTGLTGLGNVVPDASGNILPFKLPSFSLPGVSSGTAGLMS